MRKFIVLLLAIASSGATAEWVKVGSVPSPGGFAIYVDPDRIIESGDFVKMWRMYDFKAEEVSEVDGTRYLSEKVQAEYDCKDEWYRILYFTWYSGNMGNGNVVYTDNEPSGWAPVVPREIAEGNWKFACGKK